MCEPAMIQVRRHNAPARPDAQPARRRRRCSPGTTATPRACPGGPTRRACAPDPYRVWLSEIMLQQTTVAAVGPLLSSASSRSGRPSPTSPPPRSTRCCAWAGLGYYARARNLHACAQAVVERHGGRFPDTEDGLLSAARHRPLHRRRHRRDRLRPSRSPSSTAMSSASSRAAIAIDVPVPRPRPDPRLRAGRSCPPTRRAISRRR